MSRWKGIVQQSMNEPQKHRGRWERNKGLDERAMCFYLSTSTLNPSASHVMGCIRCLPPYAYSLGSSQNYDTLICPSLTRSSPGACRFSARPGSTRCSVSHAYFPVYPIFFHKREVSYAYTYDPINSKDSRSINV